MQNAEEECGMREVRPMQNAEEECGMRRLDDASSREGRYRRRMTNESVPPFGEWVERAAGARTGDPLWTVQAYRLSLYAVECHTFDRRSNARLRRAAALDQLTRAVGSISANLAEGYSRSSAADRSRFYGYALGSTREAIAWYDTLRIELGALIDQRQSILIQIRRLLLTTLRKARPEGTHGSLRDPHPPAHHREA